MAARRSVKGLDPHDRQLLSLLRADARLPTAALARELGVARTTVVQRLKRLERDGVVAGYTVRMSSRMQAHTLRVHVLLSVDAKKGEAVIGGLRGIEQVRAAYAISGKALLEELIQPSELGPFLPNASSPASTSATAR